MSEDGRGEEVKPLWFQVASCGLWESECGLGQREIRGSDVTINVSIQDLEAEGSEGLTYTRTGVPKMMLIFGKKKERKKEREIKCTPPRINGGEKDADVAARFVCCLIWDQLLDTTQTKLIV